MIKKLFILFVLFLGFGSLLAQSVSFKYDDAGNRISRKQGCETDQKVELGEPTVSICNGSSIILDAGTGFATYTWNGVEGTSQLEVTTAGTYVVEVSDESGCTSSDEVTITTLPAPEIRITDLYDQGAILPNPLIADVSETIYLVVVGGNSEGSYYWVDGNTSDRRTIPMSFIQTNYGGSVDAWVRFTNADGCMDQANITLQVAVAPQTATKSENDENNKNDEAILATNSQEEVELGEYKIYPNPTSRKFFISVSNPDKVKSIVLYDIRGNQIKSFENIKVLPLEADLSKHPKGIYILRVFEGESLKEFKIIRQ